MGGWKQKSGWIQIPPASCVSFTFPFRSQPSVCLIVSRVHAYLTTDQQCRETRPRFSVLDAQIKACRSTKRKQKSGGLGQKMTGFPSLPSFTPHPFMFLCVSSIHTTYILPSSLPKPLLLPFEFLPPPSQPFTPNTAA
jgi:hypothetical protein